MKKIYTAPEADLLCFEPLENLALTSLSNDNGGMGAGAGSGSFDQLSGAVKLPD